MSFKRIAFVLVIFSFLIFSCAFAFDWIQLHNKSDNMSIHDAVALIKEEPESPESLYLLGLACLNIHEDESARQAFEKILDKDSSNIPARWGAAEVLRREHDYESSIKILEAIIEEDPGFSPAYISLAYIRFIQMYFDESAELSYYVIKQGKDKADSSNYLRAYGLFAGAKGMIAHYGGLVSKIINGRQVMPYLKKAEALKPDSAVVHFGMGSFYLLAPYAFGRNPGLVREYLEKAIDKDPYFVDAYVRLAQVYRLEGDEMNYDLYMAKALEIDPKSPLALDIKEGTCNFICVSPRDK